MKVTCLDVPRCLVGEGPVWDVPDQALFLIDILGKKVLRYDPVRAQARQWGVPDIIGSMAVRVAGGVGMGTVLLARRMDPKRATLERRTDLTAAYVRSAVRHGLGNMPKISRGEVNDAELELISRYLVKNNAAIHSRRWQERAKPVRLELDD